MKNLSRILLFCLSAALCIGQAAPGVGAPGVSASSVAGGGGSTGTVTDVSVANTATTTGSVATGTTTPVISINVIPQPSATGNSLISGGGVGYVSGLNVTVGAASYIIQGTTYSSAITNLSAAAADPTNPRFDTVALNSSGAAVIITGTPSATPVVPQADPDTQLYLTSYLLAANATSIPVTVADIYFENTEWTMTKSGVPINLASTNNPYSGTVDIEATAAVAGNSFTATKPAAGTFDPATYNTLFFYIRNKAAWANAKSITIQFLRSGVVRGSPVTFKGGTFGFNSQTGFTAYQQVAIPTSAFGANGVTCDAVRFSVLGGGGSIGFYVDAITLQSGISPYETSTKLHWAGNYSAALAYNLNDVVLGADGIQYVAIQAGVGHTPASSTTYWAPSSGAGSPLTTKGDVYTYSTTNARLTVGSNGTIFMADSSAATGNKWTTPTYPNSATSGKVLSGDGTNIVLSTPTFPTTASATSGKVIKSDGTNWVASTETYAAPGTSGNVLTSNGTNWTSAAPAAATPTTTNLGNLTGTINIDWSLGTQFYGTLTANTTFTFSNAPAGGQTIVIRVLQTSTNTFTVTWPSMGWPGAVAPTMTGGLATRDTYTIVYMNSIYDGSYVQNIH